MGSPTRRRPGRVVAALLTLMASGFVSLIGAPVARAQAISLGPGSMEGKISVDVGDWIAVGYHFRYAGKHPAATVRFAHPTFTSFGARCADDGTAVTLVVSAPTQLFHVDQDEKGLVPSKDQADPATYEASARFGVDTPDLCTGGPLDLSRGFIFAADVGSTDTSYSITNLQFHYRVPAAKGKDNVDCSSVSAGPSVCGGGWSGSAKIVADPLVYASRISTTPSVTPFPPGTEDSATITDAAPGAAGTVTFRVYGPSDELCAQQVFERTVLVSADSSGSATVSSGTFQVSQSGEYRWTAAYSGDPASGTQPAASECGDEVVQIFSGPEAASRAAGSKLTRNSGGPTPRLATSPLRLAWAHRILVDPVW